MMHYGTCDSYNLYFKMKPVSMLLVTAEVLVRVSVKMTTVMAPSYIYKAQSLGMLPV
jgi:hypothetical protein